MIVILFIFWNFQARATHVVGGGITYTKIENDNYLLQVKLYRDCSPGTAQLPGNVNVQCRRGNDGSNPGVFSNLVLPLISVNPLQPAIPACAFDPGICVEEALYEAVVTIPDGPGGYHLYYTICCRNATILNITNPLNARETFYAYIPERGLLTPDVNSSPFFNGTPPVYVCAGEPLDLSFAAIDPDGDSLDYYFYTPYDGNNGGGINYGAGNPPNNINISPVNWVNGFGATDPLDANAGLLPGLTIDNTGYINGVPPAPGQYVVGVMVDEYRDGQLIGRISRDFQFNVITCPPPLDAIIDVTTTCNGLTVDFLNQSTGVFNNSWWDFGTGNPADSSLAFQPQFTFPSAGTYDVTLIIEKGTDCADTGSFQVTVMDPVNFTLDVDSVSCNGFGDGQASVWANDPNYLYNWSTLQQGSQITNLQPNNYWVYATNTIGCIDTQFFNVFEPNVLTNQFNITDPLCYQDQNGIIESVPTGGTAPYNFYWPNQTFNGNPLQNVGAGIYTVEITDHNGCFLSGVAAMSQPQELTAFVGQQDNVSCYGGNDGTATVIINGGTPNYTIDWLTLPNDSTTMNNLSAGNYIVEIYDANGCLETMSVSIDQPDSFYVDVVVINDETCSDANGQAFADVTNGIGVITYQWIPGGSTTDIATGLSAGPIAVTVQDENGCFAVDNALIVDHPTGTATAGNVTPVSCQGGDDGSFEVLMNGGTAPFNYSWSCACPNANIASGLSAGSYWVAVTDNNGCVDSLDFDINELPPLQVQFVNTQDPSCHDYTDGSIEVVANGGTAPYNYNWATMPPQNGPIATNLGGGSHTVYVTDDKGCQEQLAIQLTNPDELIADAQSVGNIICHGDSTGIVEATGIGGTAPYNYAWDTGDTTALVNGLPAGLYSVTVTDNNGCLSQDVAEIIEFDSVFVQINFDDVFCPGEDVNFTVWTNGQQSQYDYFWFVDHTLEGTAPSLTHPIDDSVTVAIVLVNTGNCPNIVDSTTVGPIMMIPNNVHAFSTPDTLCYGASAQLMATISDSSYISNGWWNMNLNGAGPHTISPTEDFDYIYTVENICGEQQSDTARVNIFMPPSAQIYAEGIEGCDRVEVDFSYTYDENYAYSFEGAYWNILGQQYNETNPTVVWNYSVNANSTLYLGFSNGCIFEYDSSIAVTVYESPDADFYFNPTPAIEGEETEFIDISYGNTKIWEWYVEGDFVSSIERPSYVFDEQGEYSVMQVVFDENGCSDTMEHIIEVIGSYTVYVPNAFTPDGNGVNNEFKPVVSDVDPDQYRFMVFNRWGELIFDTEVIDDSWDGTYFGENVKDDVYIWKVLVTDNVGIEHEYVGHVTLLR